MNLFVVAFSLGCLAAGQARPSYDHGTIQLQGVPDIASYSKLTYPKYDLIELGSSTKDSLPPIVVHIRQKEVVKVPQPYPVKVPVPVPHPVHIPKPYPVVETKIVQVPHPVPYEVIKKVEVPSEEFKAPHYEAPVASYEQELAQHGYGGGHENFAQQGGYESLQSAGFGGDHGQVAQEAQQGGWQQFGGGQQQEEQH